MPRRNRVAPASYSPDSDVEAAEGSQELVVDSALEVMHDNWVTEAESPDKGIPNKMLVQNIARLLGDLNIKNLVLELEAVILKPITAKVTIEDLKAKKPKDDVLEFIEEKINTEGKRGIVEATFADTKLLKSLLLACADHGIKVHVISEQSQSNLKLILKQAKLYNGEGDREIPLNLVHGAPNGHQPLFAAMSTNLEGLLLIGASCNTHDEEKKIKESGLDKIVLSAGKSIGLSATDGNGFNLAAAKELEHFLQLKVAERRSMEDIKWVNKDSLHLQATRKSPLHAAINYGSYPALKYLLKLPDCDCNVKNAFNQEPLEIILNLLTEIAEKAKTSQPKEEDNEKLQFLTRAIEPLMIRKLHDFTEVKKNPKDSGLGEEPVGDVGARTKIEAEFRGIKTCLKNIEPDKFNELSKRYLQKISDFVENHLMSPFKSLRESASITEVDLDNASSEVDKPASTPKDPQYKIVRKHLGSQQTSYEV